VRSEDPEEGAIAQSLHPKAGKLMTEKQLEATSPDEIGEAQLIEEFHPKVEVKTAFQRPKRPGRR